MAATAKKRGISLKYVGAKGYRIERMTNALIVEFYSVEGEHVFRRVGEMLSESQAQTLCDLPDFQVSISQNS